MSTSITCSAPNLHSEPDSVGAVVVAAAAVEVVVVVERRTSMNLLQPRRRIMILLHFVWCFLLQTIHPAAVVEAVVSNRIDLPSAVAAVVVVLIQTDPRFAEAVVVDYSLSNRTAQRSVVAVVAVVVGPQTGLLPAVAVVVVAAAEVVDL